MTKVFDTLREAVFIINQEKKVLYCNEPAALLCDQSERKIVRQALPLDKIFNFANEVSGLEKISEVVDPTPYQEVAFTTADGKAGKIQITLQPFGDFDNQNSWIVFFRDVTLEETLQKKYRQELEQKEGVIEDLKKAQNTLEKYSKNLEIMVAERTASLRSLNQTMSALLDSLGQGFFIFDKEGLCLEVFSKACENVLETKPAAQKVWDVLKLPEREIPGFQKWMTTLFAEMLPFEDLSPLGPQFYPHSVGKNIQLEYYPLRANDNGIQGVVVVATDITSLVEAKREAESERSMAKMLVSLVQNKRQVNTFIQEANSLIADLSAQLAKPTPSYDELFRCLHTLKGGAATFSIQAMASKCHLAENALATWKQNKFAAEFLNEVKNSCVEIERSFFAFITDNQHVLGSQDRSKERWVETPVSHFFDFSKKFFSSEQERKTFIAEFVMEPINYYFQGFQEPMQAIADRDSKKIAPLKLHNADLKVFPEAYSNLFATLVHAFRNAIDHGIEMPEERLSKGKPPEGQVEVFFDVSTENHQDWLLIKICDDGGGINPEKIRAKLTAKGIDCSQKSDENVIQHIFDSEFSTRENITDISGRGVGMDAILFAAKKLGGTALVKSQLGKGTELFIKVPFISDIEFKTQKAA